MKRIIKEIIVTVFENTGNIIKGDYKRRIYHDDTIMWLRANSGWQVNEILSNELENLYINL